jgi:hypothetical protein
MIEAKLDDIREAFEKHMRNRYDTLDTWMFAKNEFRYFDSQIEAEWQAFQAGFKFAKGEK